MPTSAGALPPRVFLDTSYVIALLVPHDQHHATAAAVSRQMIEARTQLVTTQAVVVEIGNSLSRQRYRAACLQTLRTLQTDPAPEITMCILHSRRPFLRYFRSGRVVISTQSG